MMKKINSILARLGSVGKKALGFTGSPYFRDITTQLILIPTLGLFLTVWVLSFYYFKVTHYLVPLRYSSFLGVFELGQWHRSYELPLFFSLCFLLNLILAGTIYKKDKFLAYILTASNIFIALIVLTVIINFGRLGF